MKKRLSHTLSGTVLVRLVIGSWTERVINLVYFGKLYVSCGNTKIPHLDISNSKQDVQSHDLTPLNFEQSSCVTDSCTYLESTGTATTKFRSGKEFSITNVVI